MIPVIIFSCIGHKVSNYVIVIACGPAAVRIYHKLPDITRGDFDTTYEHE